MDTEDARRAALLEATLREILRIDKEAASSDTSICYDDALDGKLLSDWQRIRSKATHLLKGS